MPVLSKSVGTSEPERDCEVQKLLPSSTRQLHKRLLRLFIFLIQQPVYTCEYLMKPFWQRTSQLFVRYRPLF
jgi:hypothetical protein